MSLNLNLKSGTTVGLDALPGLSPNAPRRGLLSLEGRPQGDPICCVLLQADEVGVLIAHLQLLQRAMEKP